MQTGFNDAFPKGIPNISPKQEIFMNTQNNAVEQLQMLQNFEQSKAPANNHTHAIARSLNTPIKLEMNGFNDAFPKAIPVTNPKLVIMNNNDNAQHQLNILRVMVCEISSSVGKYGPQSVANI
eukprot:Pgem_evm9s12025